MKSLTLVFFAAFAIALAVSDDQPDPVFDQAKIECTAETKVDKKLTDDLKNEGKLVDDPKLKEYIFCVNKKIGYQNEAGDIQAEVIRKELSKRLSVDEVNEIIEKCTGKKDTPQETGYQGLKCSIEITRRNKN